jgi:hypothetical protein
LEAVRGIIGSRQPPKDDGFTRRLWEESLWAEHESPRADRGAIEKALQNDGAVIWTFHEDPVQGGEAADPWRTPFFVRCVGGDPPTPCRTSPTSWKPPEAASRPCHRLGEAGKSAPRADGTEHRTGCHYRSTGA